MQSWIPTFYLDFYGVDIGKIGYFTGTVYPDLCLLCLGVAFPSKVVNEQYTKHMNVVVLPSAIQGAMGLFAGYLGDKLIQDWDWSSLMVRRVGQSVGSIGLGVFLLLAVKLAHTATMAMILVTIGMALNGFTMIGASAYQVNIIVEVEELFMSIVDFI